MSILQWATTAGAKGIIRDAEKDGRLKEFCSIADSTLKGFFPDDVGGVKQMIVEFVIFPFCRLWMKDDPQGFEKAKQTLFKKEDA